MAFYAVDFARLARQISILARTFTHVCVTSASCFLPFKSLKCLQFIFAMFCLVYTRNIVDQYYLLPSQAIILGSRKI